MGWESRRGRLSERENATRAQGWYRGRRLGGLLREYPLYYYEERNEANGDLFEGNADEAYGRRDGISDWSLDLFQSYFRDQSISKEDIFWYTYGILHSPEYRQNFQSDLQKVHPRLPMAGDFYAFREAGRALGVLHLNFDGVEPYPVTFKQGDLRFANIGNPEAFFRVTGMKFGGKRSSIDKSSVNVVIIFARCGAPL